MAAFELRPRGPYSLAASARFLEGFAPAAHRGAGEHLHLAFPDPEGRAAGICLREEYGVVAGRHFGAGDPDWARSEAERILSLDLDGSGFPAVGERDATIGRLQRRFAGLRPVLFMSPYEAGAWALVGYRMRIAQAARVKARMAAELGEAVDIHGDMRHAFPGPERLAALEEFPGLPGRKVAWLRALAGGAREGLLDAARLRSPAGRRGARPAPVAPGIGPFSAELILLRGAGEPDHLPSAEPRLRRAVARAYELDAEPTQEQVAELAEAWRPYRTWTAVVLPAVPRGGGPGRPYLGCLPGRAARAENLGHDTQEEDRTAGRIDAHPGRADRHRALPVLMHPGAHASGPPLMFGQRPEAQPHRSADSRRAGPPRA